MLCKQHDKLAGIQMSDQVASLLLGCGLFFFFLVKYGLACSGTDLCFDVGMRLSAEMAESCQ